MLFPSHMSRTAFIIHRTYRRAYFEVFQPKSDFEVVLLRPIHLRQFSVEFLPAVFLRLLIGILELHQIEAIAFVGSFRAV